MYTQDQLKADITLDVRSSSFWCSLWQTPWEHFSFFNTMKEKCPQGVAPTVTIWICTRLQRVIAAENSTACEEHKSTRRAGAKNVILLPENVNRLMAYESGLPPQYSRAHCWPSASWRHFLQAKNLVAQG